MADFVAVLTKTLDGLKNPTAETRERVYDKARATIAAKLAAISPPPPKAVIDRQKEHLETAIAKIESQYASKEQESQIEEDPLADFVSGAAFGKAEAAPIIKPATPPPADDDIPPYDPAQDRLDPFEGTNVSDTDEKPVRHQAVPLRSAARPKPARNSARVLMAVLALLVIGGIGYAVWLNQDGLKILAGFGPQTQDGEQSSDVKADERSTPEEGIGTQVAAADSNAAISEGNEAPAKFTQRLLEDGSEVDPGPAEGEPGIGEGTSVAAATTTPDNPATNDSGNSGNEEEGEAAATVTEDANQSGAVVPPGDTSLPVGQKAIFYEERTNDVQGSAQSGQVVWSLVQEPPGEGLPPEPAIRAEATIPEKDIQFRMTIRRNADKTLPASHIIEMIFLTADDFDGGAIDNVLRVTFKDSEQSAGNPLLGIPAKISDGFFLLALSDSKAEMEANRTMMRRLDWLDIPIVYRSGRRALITMEKGIPGSKVFDEALKAWTPEDSG